MHSGKNERLPDVYYQGRKARDQFMCCKSPPGLGMERKHWWMAGWNDRDMELRSCAA